MSKFLHDTRHPTQKITSNLDYDISILLYIHVSSFISKLWFENNEIDQGTFKGRGEYTQG